MSSSYYSTNKKIVTNIMFPTVCESRFWSPFYLLPHQKKKAHNMIFARLRNMAVFFYTQLIVFFQILY